MDDTFSQRPSKSQRKREVLALQDIGEVLVGLPANQLASIPLESRLAEAIHTARTLKTHEAKRRQLQYIGKLMRDADVQPIQEALDKIFSKDKFGKAQFHQIEKWRDQLIAEGDNVLQTFIEKFPQADSQHIRQLIRRCQQDPIIAKKSGADTELFRYIRELVLNHTPYFSLKKHTTLFSASYAFLKF